MEMELLLVLKIPLMLMILVLQPLRNVVKAMGKKKNSDDLATEIFVNEEKEMEKVLDYQTCFNKDDGEKEMEKVLEHQAQLIAKYKAEEKAQREWEEKFREYNSCTLDSCDPGNHSDVTEERDEIKTPALPGSAETISRSCDVKSEAVDVSAGQDLQVNHLPENVDMKCLQDLNCCNMDATDSSASEFAFSTPKEKQGQEYSEYDQRPVLSSSHPRAHIHNNGGNKTAGISSSCVASRLSSFGVSESTNELAVIPHQTPDNIGSVLEALQQAKLSLKHKGDTSSLVEGGSVGNGNAIEPYIPPPRLRDEFKIPVGCDGLFRFPTNLQSKTSNPSSILGSDSQFSLTNYSGDYVSDKLFPAPYMESSRSRVLMDNQFLTVPVSPYMETREGIPTKTLANKLSFRSGLPSSNAYAYTSPQSSATLPFSRENADTTYPRFWNPMSKMSSTGITRPPSKEVGFPPESRFSFYDNRSDGNMYW